MLAQFRQNDGQPPLEEDRQVVEGTTPEIKPETKPDYRAVCDRVLRTLTTRVATTSPQYKTAIKALDRFILELETDPKVPPKK